MPVQGPLCRLASVNPCRSPSPPPRIRCDAAGAATASNPGGRCSHRCAACRWDRSAAAFCHWRSFRWSHFHRLVSSVSNVRPTSYGDPIILLFMGGFMISKAAEHWAAHRRIAQATINAVGGTSGRRLVFAVMLATALISMWISNTATALMMLPVAIALIDRDLTGRLAVPLLLGVAYSASIGGIATPIGTAPNGIFMANYEPVTGHTIPFYQWMILGFPLSLVLLVAAWLLLTFRLGDLQELRVEAHEQWTTPQKRTLFIFGLACLAWVTPRNSVRRLVAMASDPEKWCRRYDRRDRRHITTFYNA